MQPIDFWIKYGSTYTYLSVARIGKLAAVSGVQLRWQPFFLLPIMAELGMTQGPFVPYPAKTEHMWRDIERRAARHSIPYAKPQPIRSIRFSLPAWPASPRKRAGAKPSLKVSTACTGPGTF